MDDSVLLDGFQVLLKMLPVIFLNSFLLIQRILVKGVQLREQFLVGQQMIVDISLTFYIQLPQLVLNRSLDGAKILEKMVFPSYRPKSLHVVNGLNGIFKVVSREHRAKLHRILLHMPPTKFAYTVEPSSTGLMLLMIDCRGIALDLDPAKPSRLAIRVQTESFACWPFLVEPIIEEDGIGPLSVFHCKLLY